MSFPQNIITMIKSARMRWAGHVTRMKELRLVGESRKDLGENVRMILKWTLNK